MSQALSALIDCEDVLADVVSELHCVWLAAGNSDQVQKEAAAAFQLVLHDAKLRLAGMQDYFDIIKPKL